MASINFDAITEQLYKAKDIVAAEPVGLTTSVTLNIGADGVSQGATIKSVATPTLTVNESDAESMSLPEGDAATAGVEEMTLAYTANVKIELSGNDWTKLTNVGQADATMADLYQQALRGIRNKIESVACGHVYKYASRSVGTSGTTPFASDFKILNSLRQVLEDNGAPVDDGQCSVILNTLAATNLRNLAQLQKANEAGSDLLLRRGTLLDLSGFMLKSSAGIASHTKGAGTGYDIVTAGEAIGQTTLTLEGGTVNSTGIKAGDVITIDTDTANAYVVNTGLTATGGDIVIGKPGLRVAGVNASELTVVDSYTANLAVHRAAVEIAMRPPGMPPGGDAGDHIATIVDAKSGIVVDVVMYYGKRKNTMNFTVHYGVKVWKEAFVASLRG